MIIAKHQIIICLELEDRLIPESCHLSLIYGRQTLRAGEKAFCENGWTVCSCFALVDFAIIDLLLENRKEIYEACLSQLSSISR